MNIMKRAGRIMVVLLFSLMNIGIVSQTVEAGPPKMSIIYEGYEIKDNKLYANVKVVNNTFNLKKRSTTPQKMILRLIKGRVTVEVNGVKIIDNQKKRWLFNECVMPEKKLSIYLGEINVPVGAKLKVEINGLSSKSVIDKRQAHCSVTEWKWDSEKKTARIVLDICNDHYYDVLVNGVEVEYKNADITKIFTWNDIQLMVPKYSHMQLVLYTPQLNINGEFKGEFQAKRIHRKFIIPPKPDAEESEYVVASVPENAYEYDDYEYTAENIITDGDSKSAKESDDEFAVVTSKDASDDEFAVVTSTESDDEFAVVTSK